MLFRSAVNQEVINQQLSLLGHQADIACDGHEAWVRWMTGRYDLLLTDIHMPRMDGYQLTQAIRDEEAKSGRSRTIIIALTAIAMKGEAERCKALGIDDYLSKPAPLSELRAMLEKWLSIRATTNNDVSPINEVITPEQPELPDWDPQALNQIVGADPLLHQRFRSRFMETAHPQLETLRAAMASHDIKTLGFTAHALKSSARAIGALRLGECCQRLESASKAGDESACKLLLPELLEAFIRVENIIAD